MAKKIVIFFGVVFIIGLIFIKPFSKLRELNMKNKVLMEEMTHLKNVNEGLKKEKKALEEDLEFIERRAREKMGVVREGEIIYKTDREEE